MKKIIVESLATGQKSLLTVTTDHGASSYGQPVWVDADNECYGQAVFVDNYNGPHAVAPLGFKILWDAADIWDDIEIFCRDGSHIQNFVYPPWLFEKVQEIYLSVKANKTKDFCGDCKKACNEIMQLIIDTPEPKPLKSKIYDHLRWIRGELGGKRWEELETPEAAPIFAEYEKMADAEGHHLEHEFWRQDLDTLTAKTVKKLLEALK